jgi:type IV pilus assembly protein PilE
MRKLSAKPRGFTLIELLIVCAVAGVLVTVAWPSLRPSWLQAGRADAVQALTTLQQRQARHHAQHGLYSLDGGSSTSPQGLYAVTVDVIRAEGYSASATALPGSRQAADGDCARLTVSIERGFASLGPSARCWNQ